MANILQLRRGTTAQNDAFTGSIAEVTVDTDRDSLRVHDSVTQGGIEIANLATAIPLLPDATTVGPSDELVVRQSGVVKRATSNELLNGTGTVTSTGSTTGRTLKDRFADAKSLKDFGLVNSETLDQTALLQSVLDNLPDNCEVLWDCVVRITSLVDTSMNGIHFRGVNGGGILIDACLGFKVRGNNNRFEGIRFYNPSRTVQASVSGYGLSIVGYRNRVMGCRFESFLNACGIDYSSWPPDGNSGFDNIFSNNLVLDCRGVNSESAGEPIHSHASRTLIDGNIVIGASDSVGSDLLHGIKVDGNYIQDPTNADIGSGTGCVISNNIVFGAFQHCIYAEGMDGTVVSGNTVLGSSGDGIKSTANRNCVVGNVVQAGSIGINLFRGAYQLISNNVVFAGTILASGIYVDRWAHNATISGNRFVATVPSGQQYTVTGASGTFVNDSIITSSSGRAARICSLSGSTLFVDQVQGYFNVGETLTQSGGWTATVSAALTYNYSFNRAINVEDVADIIIENNTVSEGACSEAIRVFAADRTTIRNNSIYRGGTTGSAISVNNTSDKPIIVGNILRDIQNGIGISVSGVSATQSIIRGNIVETTGARGIDQFGGTIQVLEDNIVSGATTANISLRGGATVANTGSATYNPPSLAGNTLSGTATYDPPSLNDGVGTTTTVTVTGAVVGDFAEATFSNDLQGITLTAWVSAAGTVSARFQNESGGTLDLASGTLTARILRANGGSATTTVTVTGAALGDYAEASFSLDLQGITLTAWVSATDTVSVRFDNETGSTVDLGSGTLRARVFKPL